MAWKSPGCPLILTTLFLLPPFLLTSFNLSANNFLQSSLSYFDKSRLRITLLKLSLSFNLLLLSRTMFLVSKLSNFINNGLGFGDSSTFLPIQNISEISFSIFCLLLLSGALTRVLFLLTFQYLLLNCRLSCCSVFFVFHCSFLSLSSCLSLIIGLSHWIPRTRRTRSNLRFTTDLFLSILTFMIFTT